MIPSSALLKAMLINSATPTSGELPTVGLKKRNAIAPPSQDQGFGQIQLSNVLRFKDDPPSRTLVIQDDIPPLMQTEHHLYCFRIQTGIKVSQ